MKKVLTICAVIALVVAFIGPASAANTISYGTAGTGATATHVCEGLELYTADGGLGSAYVRLNIDGGIALGAITSLSYTAKITSFTGVSTPAPEVVLNIDADGDGLEGTGLAWMTPPMHQPSALEDDNFLSGDFWPFLTSVDTDFVTRNALGGDYFYWSANDDRDGFGDFWTQFSTVLGSWLPRHDIELTDKVYSIDFIVGTSGNWQESEAQISSVELNGTTYTLFGVVECVGFEPPCDNGPVTLKKNRVLPLKVELVDCDGFPVTDSDIAPPVIQVMYAPTVADGAGDVTEFAYPVGQGTEGNQFEFSGSKWQYNLKTKEYTAPGTYTVTMVPGDGTYGIDPTCEVQFVIE